MSQPIYSGNSPAEVAADVAHLLAFHEDGLSLPELEALITQRLLPHLMRYDRTQFQSMFNAFPPDEARLGAEIALAYNQGVTNWQVSPGGATLEEMCGRALCHLFGLADTADATFMYSGTYGNQQALYMALHRLAQRQGFDLAQKGIAGFADPARLAVVVGESSHFSIKQAVRMLGLGEDCLVTVPLDDRFRLDAAALRRIVAEIRPSRDIVCIVATAGSTSTGAVDPLAAIADVCAEVDTWFHVDGAYGYAYKLVPEVAQLFHGDGRADSITWDPHKQLGAPIPNSLLFVRNGADFSRMTVYSSYFNRKEDAVPNPGLKSPPSTRPMSVLPLVAILRGQGLGRVVAGLRAHLTAIRETADYIQSHAFVTLVHRPDTGILCFRLTPPGTSEAEVDALQQHLYDAVMGSGERSIATTRLNGRQVLRLVTVSSRTTTADLIATVDYLLTLL